MLLEKGALISAFAVPKGGKEYANKQQSNTCILYIYKRKKRANVAVQFRCSVVFDTVCLLSCAVCFFVFCFFVFCFQWAGGRCD